MSVVVLSTLEDILDLVCAVLEHSDKEWRVNRGSCDLARLWDSCLLTSVTMKLDSSLLPPGFGHSTTSSRAYKQQL